MTTAQNARAEAHGHGHHHRDVSGGWLRPTVFGAMDGLVTNVSLIAGVGAASVSRHFVILTGLAGLAAGAFSMAAGEYVSVSSQNELVGSEIRKERLELQNNPVAEQRELAAMFRARGVDPVVAREVAAQISRNPDHALNVHVREELGVDPHDLPSPLIAAGASLVSFSTGALVPLLPYLAGAAYLWLTLALAALAAIIGGGAVARLTGRPLIVGAARQLFLGTLAAGLTFGIGHLVGGSVG